MCMEEKILKELGLKIKQTRMSIPLSQEELAWRCGITKNGLGKIELGRSQVRITTLIKIFNQLNLDFYIIQELVNNSKNHISLN